MSLTTPISVQKLQTALHAKAKESPNLRFHALYDKVYRKDVLAYAYDHCRANGGAAGVDSQTFENIEEYGRERWLEELAQELKSRTYQPQPVRRVYIPKPDGKQRPLGIPTVASKCTCSNPIQDAEEILPELRTQSRNVCSSAALSVIQYGIPSLSRRAASTRCSIQ
jgi:retron-type reverse transcriptase